MLSQKFIIGILGLPVNKNGEFLVTLRQDKRKLVHNKWQIAGGKPEFGETPEQTLTREMGEELGVTPTIIFPHPILATQTWNWQGHGQHVALASYLVDIGNQPIKLNHEASRYEWVTLDTLDHQNSLPATITTIKSAETLIEEINLLAKLGE